MPRLAPSRLPQAKNARWPTSFSHASCSPPVLEGRLQTPYHAHVCLAVSEASMAPIVPPKREQELPCALCRRRRQAKAARRQREAGVKRSCGEHSKQVKRAWNDSEQSEGVKMVPKTMKRAPKTVKGRQRLWNCAKDCKPGATDCETGAKDCEEGAKVRETGAKDERCCPRAAATPAPAREGPPTFRRPYLLHTPLPPAPPHQPFAPRTGPAVKLKGTRRTLRKEIFNSTFRICKIVNYFEFSLLSQNAGTLSDVTFHETVKTFHLWLKKNSLPKFTFSLHQFRV